MTPNKTLMASLLALAVLAAGCAGGDDGAESTDAGDENADLYGGDQAPQPGDEDVTTVSGDASANATAEGDATTTSS